MTQQLFFLELNEINFNYIQTYIERGELPNMAWLIRQHGIFETTSEDKHEELEPWIQWVTAHAGLSLADHGVFRLGDILKRDIPQIWEQLEEKGLKVGAISPMNAKNRTKKAAFFVPDPWTSAKLTARPILQKLYHAVAQVVNDNAQSRVTAGSVVSLLMGAVFYARVENYYQYLSLAMHARKKPWSRAMFLDQLLADVFIHETKKSKPDFATLFLNAGAHIQHHYMFNSAAYDGGEKNPEWYIDSHLDPVLEVYRLYDRIIAQIRRAFPVARIMMATGLHQDPHPEVTYYWRLKDHASYLSKIGVPFKHVEPRMSRDFLINCSSAEEAKTAQDILQRALDENKVPIFEVDNRGTDLFVMLTYPNAIRKDFSYMVGNKNYADLKEDVAFVAIKNGQHNGTGYFIDTGAQPGPSMQFPLAEIPSRICQAMGTKWL